MPSSNPVTTSPQTTRSWVPLLLIAVVTVALVAVLPRAILSAASVGGKAAVKNQTVPAPVFGDKAQFAVLVRASDLLEAGGEGSKAQAARLLDSLSDAPLAVSDTDNVAASGTSTAFSSTLLLMRLGRQMQEAARTSPCAASGATQTCSARQKADALQWTYRCRKIADAVLVAPSASLAALKIAHYLDTVAGRQETALYRAWGDAAGFQNAASRRDAVRRVWNTQILPLLSDDSFHLMRGAWDGVSESGPTPEEAAWSARVALMLALYQKDRPFISAA